jgi:hypothetical protein
MKIWDNPDIVTYSPIVTTCLLESANIGQMIRMWTYHTAAGQSLISWAAVQIALWLWQNFYRVITPDQWIARLTIKIGILLNFGVILSVIYWRYLV